MIQSGDYTNVLELRQLRPPFLWLSLEDTNHAFHYTNDGFAEEYQSEELQMFDQVCEIETKNALDEKHFNNGNSDPIAWTASTNACGHLSSRHTKWPVSPVQFSL